jgi:hypothetical protein
MYQVYLAWAGVKLTTLVVIGTDCIGSCKSKLTITSIDLKCFIKKFVLQFLHIKWVFLKFCMVAYFHMEACIYGISLQLFDETISEGFIALFD